jgi:hypothetical protein
MSTHGLKIEVVWFDDDMIELRFRAASRKFAGETTLYAALDAPETLARALEGFPHDPTDARKVEFGQANLPGYGVVTMQLRCTDSVGHSILQVEMQTSSSSMRAVRESAVVNLFILPASIDTFVAELRQMRVRVGDLATLQDAI